MIHWPHSKISMAKASNPDDLETMLQQCFNICITRQELEAPTTAVVTRVLRGAFETFGLNEVALEVPCSILPSEAMHIEGSVSLSHYLKLMQAVFGLLGVNDVGLQDLTNPKPKRTRRLFKILVNKLLYTTSVFTKYTAKLKQQLDAKAKGEHALSMLNATTAKANKLATQLHNGGEQQQAIADELAACEKTLAAYDLKKTDIMSHYKQLKMTLCASAEAVQKAELDIVNLKETLEERRAAVCNDPAAWKEKTSADAETLAVLKSEIEKFRAGVSAVNEKIGLAPRISEEYQKTLESIAEMEGRSVEAEALQQRKAAQEKKRIELEQLHYALQKKVELATEEHKRLMERQPHDAGLQSREQRNHDARQQLQQLKTTMKQTRASATAKLSELDARISSMQEEISTCEKATEWHVARNQQVIDRMLEYLNLLVERFETTFNEDSLPQMCSEDKLLRSTSEDEQPQLSSEDGQPGL
ncbi:coiled-coil domain-containing protein 69-B-like isoform X2 [Dermacentor albipictus]|uniref:coiled-coil domain-containing protein 69-B-like isoform X2 n=1 Tax=Dermacentor albipictus TaxID=60249 RepID=UPI0031FD1CF8